MGGESFFDIVDENEPTHDDGYVFILPYYNVQGLSLTEHSMTSNLLPPKTTMAEDPKPGYQHRTRPDQPAAPAGIAEQKRPFTRVVSNDAAARARRMNAIMAADTGTAPPTPEVRSEGHKSSGGSTSVNNGQGQGQSDGRPPPRAVNNLPQAVQAGPSVSSSSLRV